MIEEIVCPACNTVVAGIDPEWETRALAAEAEQERLQQLLLNAYTRVNHETLLRDHEIDRLEKLLSNAKSGLEMIASLRDAEVAVSIAKMILENLEE